MGPSSPQAGRPPPRVPPGSPRLRLVLAQAATGCETVQPVTIVGSRRDCDLYIEHAEVSKLHCAIVNDGHGLTLIDLCSRSGTFVDDRRLTGPHPLRHGESFRLGPVTLSVELEPTEAAPRQTCEHPPTLHVGSAAHELSRLPAIVGRRAACDLVLDTPDVSLCHALLLLLDGRLAVCDLGSRSGTLLNGQRIELAWVCDGDELGIGGETLRVAWNGPHHEPAAGQTPSSGDEPVTVNLSGDELDDLGAMIEALRAQIAASRQRLSQREAGLDRREAELRRREEDLQQREQDLTAERTALDQTAVTLAERERQLEHKQEEIDRQRRQLEQERRDWQQQLDECRQTLDELAQRERAVEQRERAVADAERELAQRRHTLAGELARLEELSARIEQFRESLRAARRWFDEQPEPNAEPPPSEPETEGPLAVAELPGPLVEQPVLGSDQPTIDDLPADLRQRLHTLRRTTGRSEAELLPQVWAEYEARGRGGAPRRSKKKRRWLS